MANDRTGQGSVSRREFTARAGAAAVGIAVGGDVFSGGLRAAPLVGGRVLGANDRVVTASIGIRGQGNSLKRGFAKLKNVEIKTLCDIDANLAPERIHDTRLSDVASFKPGFAQDLRRVLDDKDIDAVVIATPDHMHAAIALAAMDLGKHVYVQKPLTWSVAEARQLARRAKSTRVATQMGNQGHSWNDARTAVEYVWAGAIGEVREVHVWTNRPLGYWPQGIPRPEARTAPANGFRWNGPGIEGRLATAMTGSYPKPDGLAWDLFLGVAPWVEYHPVYHPFNWRGWVDWGCGAIGDMGAHLMDHAMWALDLGYPTMIETLATPFNGACFPNATMTVYDFPARNGQPPVKLTWYDGGLKPPKPIELGEGQELSATGGALLVGSKGKLLHDTYGANPRLLPDSLHASFGKPAQKLPRIPHENHEMNWVDAAKGKTAASCPFEYASKLTEVMLLGVVALKAGRKIEYDAANMRITNVPGANQYLEREARAGWSL